MVLGKSDSVVISLPRSCLWIHDVLQRAERVTLFGSSLEQEVCALMLVAGRRAQ